MQGPKIPIRTANHRKSSGFGLKMMMTFSAFVIVPSLLTASFSMLFLKKHLGSWFHGQVRTVLQDADHISQGYLQEHEKSLAYIVSMMAKGLFALLAQEGPLDPKEGPSQVVPLIERYSQDLTDYLNVHEVLRKVPCLILIGPKQPKAPPRVLASSDNGPIDLALSLDFETFEFAKASGIKTTLYPQAGMMSVLMPLSLLPDAYLFVTRSIDTDILTKINRAKSATQAYQLLLAQQQSMAWQFAGALALVTLALLVLATLSGLVLSRKIITPVEVLIQWARTMRIGSFTPIDWRRIPSTQALRALLGTFESMAYEIVERKKALEQANLRLNARTIALETVLAGVSSGVISTTLDGQILLANQRARELLSWRKSQGNCHFTDLIQEAEQAFANAIAEPGKIEDLELTIARLGRALTLRMHLLAHQDSNQVIITFDDIGPLILAQKQSAWTDVAQRVAHEIKNPLTPITLSAQRLQRRYGAKIQDEPEVFQDCLDTIVRQVRHIGTLVSEFTAFARLPAPQLKKVALDLLVQQEVRLQQEAYPKIHFQLNLEPIFVCADGGQIGQVLNNVLKNAIESILERKEDGQPGWIVLVLAADQNQAILSVCDNGIGLPKDLKDPSPDATGGRTKGDNQTSANQSGNGLIATRGNASGLTDLPSAGRAAKTTKSYGMGLGLAIVQKIIQDHKGQFTLAPGPNLLTHKDASSWSTHEKGTGSGDLQASKAQDQKAQTIEKRSSIGACARITLPLWRPED
jgi:two-component system, NtrC family, nitrogen regulation sensor histidine kinase NtrY